MDISFSDKKMIFNKEFRAIDEFTFSFVSCLEKAKIKYVLVSGYVVLFFGRDRSTEDMFIEDMKFDKFSELWAIVSNAFECMNVKNAETAYDFLKSGVALRFHKKDTFIPNMEFKPLKTDLDRYSLENRMEVECNGKTIYLSPLELQVAYKLQLGSDKDLEDARFIYKLFKEYLDKQKLGLMLNRLHISTKKFESSIGERLE